MEFNVGDRVVVVVTAHNNHDNVANAHGTIAVVDGNICGVVFDENVGGHNLADRSHPHGVCKCGYGWWMLRSELKLESAECTEDEISVNEEAFSYA